ERAGELVGGEGEVGLGGPSFPLPVRLVPLVALGLLVAARAAQGQQGGHRQTAQAAPEHGKHGRPLPLTPGRRWAPGTAAGSARSARPAASGPRWAASRPS